MTDPADNTSRDLTASPMGQFDLVLQQLDSLAVQPAVALQVLQIASQSPATTDQNGASDRIGKLISSDPALVVQLLRTAAETGLADASGIAQAIDRVGMDSLRPALLAMHLPPASGQAPIEPGDLTTHCQAVAIAAQTLAERTGLCPPEQAYLAGLLHDMGKLALLEAFPKAYGRALQAARVHRGNLLEYERLILGVDHVVFGRRLAEKWRLPQAISHCIWLHHQPTEAVPASLGQSEMINLISLADAIVRQMEIGFSGNLAPTPSLVHLAGPLGIDAEEIQQVCLQLPEQVQRFRSERQLDIPADHRSLYRAQTAANLVLGRLFRRLQVSNRQQGHSRQLSELVSYVLDNLHHDSTLSEAMVSSAETFAHLLGGRVVIYSMVRAGGELLLACLVDGQVQWRCLQARRDALVGPMPTGTTLSDHALSRLVEDTESLQDWVDPGGVHLPTTWSGRWTGGLFVGPHYRADQIDQAQKLNSAISPILGLVQDRANARALADELAGTSANLASTQQALAEQTTLTAIGEMAAGAAHELNTPLAVISGRAQLMKERAADPGDRNVWAQVADQAQLISDIISDLMDFASPSPPHLGCFHPGELLDDAAKEFSCSNHPQAKTFSFDKTNGQSLPRVRADRDQVRAAIVELVTNAANASPGGGRICLGAEADPTGATVLLRIQDFGCGMDQETLANAYTPFFSAHQAGRRRGLGLPRAKRYVEGSGGRIWIQSRPHEGTTVFVQLPTESGSKHRGSSA